MIKQKKILYISKLIEPQLKHETISKEEDNIQNTKDLLDIINKTNNPTLISNTLDILIKAIPNNQNKNNKKDNNQIKNSSEHNKLIDNNNIKKSFKIKENA